MSNSRKNNQLNTPVRLPQRKIPSIENWILPVFSTGTALMTFSAANNLLDSPTKAILLGGAAGLVSYSTNYFAINKGAELAAIGFKSAIFTSVLSISAVGAGLFPSTYAGLVINDVSELQLHDYSIKQARYIDGQNQLATKPTRLIPIIRVNEEELNQYRNCEQRESCLSGRGHGGRGSVTKALEAKARKAKSITESLIVGETARKESLNRQNNLREAFLNILNDTSLSIKDRRKKLSAFNAKINQELDILKEALPISLLKSYVNELEKGVSIQNRALATKRINAILNKQAKSLTSGLSTLKETKHERPEFPMPAGVSTTFDYILHFLPIAALTASIELILPISLWIYVLLGFIWRKHKEDLERIDFSSQTTQETSPISAKKFDTPRRIYSKNTH